MIRQVSASLKDSEPQRNGCHAPRQMSVVHLTASPCFGGPERQMLELGSELQEKCRSAYISFLEEGRCWDFIQEAERRGFASFALKHDTPRLLAALRELVTLLRKFDATILCCHGYKAGILGRIAARQVGIPIIAVSRGWTGESQQVRVFEFLDRFNLRWMDRVVCVSEAQAKKVRQAGVREERIAVIHNAIRPKRFENPDPAYREQLRQMFPEPPQMIVGAAGRLSPEKGFSVLIDAAEKVLGSGFGVQGSGINVGFILFGDGPLRDSLARQIAARGLEGKFILGGFRANLDHLLPHFDLMVLPSFSEGLPNVALEALAAGVPVVATAVGGTPEIIEDGVSGYLVESGDVAALARRIVDMLSNNSGRRAMGLCGQKQVKERFSFPSQAREYDRLFDNLLSTNGKAQS